MMFWRLNLNEVRPNCEMYLSLSKPVSSLISRTAVCTNVSPRS